MSYTVITPKGIRFTLCPPGISEGADSGRQQVGNRENGGHYAMVALTPAEARMYAPRRGNLSAKRTKKSPGHGSADPINPTRP